jgi:hypothetical protein
MLELTWVAAMTQKSTLIEPPGPINPPSNAFDFGNRSIGVPGTMENVLGAATGEISR